MLGFVLRLILALILEKISPPSKKKPSRLLLKPKIYMAPVDTVLPLVPYGSEWPEPWEKVSW